MNEQKIRKIKEFIESCGMECGRIYPVHDTWIIEIEEKENKQEIGVMRKLKEKQQ